MSDLAGGIRNAMERKEPVEKIRLSFLNAGYSAEEVNQAVQEATSSVFSIQSEAVPKSAPQTVSAPDAATPTSIQVPNPIPSSATLPVPAFQPLPSEMSKAKLKIPGRTIYIIGGIVSVLILVSAALLGLFWDKIFA